MKTLRPVSTSLSRITTSHYTPAYTCSAVSIASHTNHDRQLVQLQQQRRTFLANPFASNGPQTISATRTLPYPSQQIFNVITDVSSYRHYYPFCIESTVSKISNAASNGMTYPEEAKLVVGWQDTAREEFWSRIYCVPERIVEAVSGNTQTSLQADDIQHHNPRPAASEDPTRKDEIVEHLLTRWTLRPLDGKDKEQTQVDLRIELQFANPFYAALSQAAVPRVAEKMIEAFQKRLEEVDRQEHRQNINDRGR